MVNEDRPTKSVMTSIDARPQLHRLHFVPAQMVWIANRDVIPVIYVLICAYIMFDLHVDGPVMKTIMLTEIESTVRWMVGGLRIGTDPTPRWMVDGLIMWDLLAIDVICLWPLLALAAIVFVAVCIDVILFLLKTADSIRELLSDVIVFLLNVADLIRWLLVDVIVSLLETVYVLRRMLIPYL